MPTLEQFEDEDGACPFSEWYDSLDNHAAAKIRRHLLKLEHGLRPDVESVGQGVFETKIHFGPGYRVYFGLDGSEIIVLLGGGDKRFQREDIANAQRCWAKYKTRKKEVTRHATNP